MLRIISNFPLCVNFYILILVLLILFLLPELFFPPPVNSKSINLTGPFLRSELVFFYCTENNIVFLWQTNETPK